MNMNTDSYGKLNQNYVKRIQDTITKALNEYPRVMKCPGCWGQDPCSLWTRNTLFLLPTGGYDSNLRLFTSPLTPALPAPLLTGIFSSDRV